jgi:peptidoglycan/LPS O-acetylase OafA/YrhL
MESNTFNFEVTNQLRGLAILMVIAGHMELTSALNNSGGWGVAIFLMLSGFGLTLSYQKKGLKNFFRKKLFKVLLPYSAVTIILLAADKVIFHRQYGILKSLLAILGLGFRSPVDGTMWYVTYILIWYLVFYCIFRLNINFKLKLVLTGLASAACYLAISIILPDTTVIRNYSFNFLLGVTLAAANNKINAINSVTIKRYLALIPIPCAIIFYIFNYRITFGNDKVNPVSLIAFAIGSIAVVSLYSMHNLKSRLLQFIGKISYEMYLVEGVILFKYSSILDFSSYKYTRLGLSFIIIVASGYLLNFLFGKITPLISKAVFPRIRVLKASH